MVDGAQGFSGEVGFVSDQAVPVLPPSVDQESQQFRSQVGHISRHSGAFFAGTIFSVALGYVFKVYLARTLGAEALGIYALGMTLVGFAGIFGGLGLTWAAAKFPQVYCSRGETENLRSFVVSSVLVLATVNGALAIGVVMARRWLCIRFYHTPALVPYIYLFAVSMFVGALTTFFGQLLTGYKEVAKRTLVSTFLGSVVTMLLTILLVKIGTGLWGYVFAQVVSGVVVVAILAVLAYIATPRTARFWWRLPQSFPQGMFTFAAAAFAMDLMGFLYTQTDKVILGFYLHARDVGIYAVAGSIVGFLSIALQSVNQIFSPTISGLHAQGQTTLLNRLFQTLTKWTTGLTIPLAAVVVIFSRPLMLVFGRDFEAGWIIVVIGAAGQLVNCAVGSVGYLLLMSGHEKKLIQIQFLVGTLTVFSCMLLVPRWGVTGAAVAAALGNASSNALCLMEVKRSLGLFPYNRGYLRLVMPCTAAIITAWALHVAFRSEHLQIAVIVVSTMLVYAVFVGSALWVGLEPDDRLILDAIWQRVRGLISTAL